MIWERYYFAYIEILSERLCPSKLFLGADAYINLRRGVGIGGDALLDKDKES